MVLVCRHEGYWRAYLAGGGLVLSLSSGALAVAQQATQLNQPAPSAREIQKPPQQVPAQNPRVPEADQRDAQQPPPLVQIVRPANSNQQAAQDQTDKAEKAATDWWIVTLTGALVIVGVIQAIVLGVQAIVFWVQASRLKETIKAMERIDAGQAAKVQESIAQAARAANAMESLAVITQNSERPYIFLSGVDEIGCEEDHGYGYPVIRCVIANCGKTPAKLKSVRVYIGLCQKPDECEAIEDWHSLVTSPILTSGEKRERVTFYVPRKLSLCEGWNEESGSRFETPELPDFYYPAEGITVVFRVVIGYNGPFTTGHETSGCWTAKKRTGFTEYKSDTYNYTK